MLVTVATFTNPLEAHIVRGRLQAEGIEVYVAHEHHIWANWFLSTALGGVKLQVSPEDVQRADEILQHERVGDYEGLLPDAEPPDTEPQPTCPVCYSLDITAFRRSGRLSLFIVWLSSLPLPYSSNSMVCRNCGNTWVNRGAQSYTVVTRFYVIALLALLFFLLIRGMYYLCSINEINPICS
jgi:Putative prokaryotic signal transducing protein